MTDKDMDLIARYYTAKSISATYYAVSIRESKNLESSLNFLFEWQFHVDHQLKIWNQMKETKRIEGIMIASGFTG